MKLNFCIARQFINKLFILFERLLSLAQKYCYYHTSMYSLLGSFPLFMTTLQNIYLITPSYSWKKPNMFRYKAMGFYILDYLLLWIMCSKLWLLCKHDCYKRVACKQRFWYLSLWFFSLIQFLAAVKCYKQKIKNNPRNTSISFSHSLSLFNFSLFKKHFNSRQRDKMQDNPLEDKTDV